MLETNNHARDKQSEPEGQRDRGGQTDGETIMLETNNQRAKGAEG